MLSTATNLTQNLRSAREICEPRAIPTNGAVLTDTFGDRVVAIRQARGGGARKALKQPEMAELLRQAAGVDLDSSRLSRIEAGKELKFYEALAILRALKALDPEGRGYDWLIGTEPLPTRAVEKPERPPREFAKPSDSVNLPRREPDAKQPRRRHGNHG